MDSAAAFDEFNKIISDVHKDRQWVRLAMALLVRDLPNGPQQTRNILENLLEDNPTGLIVRHAMLALCLVSTPDEIKDRVKRLPFDLSAELKSGGGLWGHAPWMNFLAGNVDDTQLLERSQGHNYSKAIAHYAIAMMRLSAGHKAGAREQFELCVATNAVGSFDYEMGRAYLAKMKADPKWPTWIQDKVDK